jgi:DNA-binding MarR family transcriptional regulator
VLQRIWKIADQARNEALADLGAAEREQLIELLERVHRTLSTLDAQEAR